MKIITLSLEDFVSIVGLANLSATYPKAQRQVDQLINTVMEDNKVSVEEYIDAGLAGTEKALLKK